MMESSRIEEVEGEGTTEQGHPPGRVKGGSSGVAAAIKTAREQSRLGELRVTKEMRMKRSMSTQEDYVAGDSLPNPGEHFVERIKLIVCVHTP